MSSGSPSAPIASTPTARSFLVNRAGRLHQAWDQSNSQYDPLQDQYVAKTMSSDDVSVSQYTAHFIKVMELVRDDSPRGALLQSFDIRRAHSWAEVRLEAGLAAQTDYQTTKLKGLRGFLPRIGRKIGEMQPAIEPIATTLPAGDYTSLVCGGVVLMFKAFDHVTKVREKVVESLGEYPDLLEYVQDLLELYPEDAKLRHKTVSLYVALLVTVEGMIAWFKESTWLRVKALMQQGLYARDLKDKIAYMERCGRELQKQAELCSMKRTDQVFQSVQGITVGMNVMSDSLEDGFEAVEEQVRKAGDKTSVDIKNLQATITAHNSTLVAQNEVINKMTTLLSSVEWDQAAVLKEKARIEAAKAEVESARAKAAEYLVQQLNWEKQQMLAVQQLSRVDVLQSLTLTPQDTATAAQFYSRYSHVQGSQKDISGYLMDNRKFTEWFSSSVSRKLLVQPPPTTSKISSGSFAAATLYQAFTRIQSAVTLTYFCPAEKSESGWDPAQLLLTDLLYQVLASYDYDLSEWSAVTSIRDHQDFLKYRDTDYLCSFFKYLIKASPYDVVFCIIDDIRRLEDPPSSMTTAVLAMLDQLIASSNVEGSIAFKLMLFTARHKGSLIANTETKDIIRIRDEDLRNSSSPTPRKLAKLADKFDGLHVQLIEKPLLHDPPPYAP